VRVCEILLQYSIRLMVAEELPQDAAVWDLTKTLFD
jgi:hypothetical protein